ncbi:thiopurine S-methyltransferase [Chthoniobacter flavus Ellin428]|uniref:Thiopurine S-methyltransferase n=1 Tax=Chthoniobacter flavus Ellin428 TaxID=497964 RepID=B4D2A0_9BACT|nr:methyltransferase domain-containing protein [Chthoniobacter flavus]EDY19340.1 thiopurine S-methyltransferase [Chthoniobacter flavus Ellin428]TCO90529.1 thiopurine S-methyltransferase [Chthoniobacter flavus]
MSTNWNEQYEKQDTPWDKGSPSPGLVDFLATEPVQGRVLVPGCGFGHDVRALAATADEVVGLDIAPLAVEGADRLPKVGHERYALGDFFNLPAEMRGAFDWVFEHTCFCAIHPSQRPAYVASVAAALKPGGRYLAIFYLDPGNDSPDEGPPFEVSVAELDRLFSPHFTLVREWLPQRTYPGREGREWMRVMQLKSV